MFRFAHNNINITDTEKSVQFYHKALGLTVDHVKEDPNGNYTLTFLTDGCGGHQLELTCLKDHPQPYDLGENEIHLAFATDDMEAAKALHREMDCICFENESMGVYFIEDPDGYWLEIVPAKK